MVLFLATNYQQHSMMNGYLCMLRESRVKHGTDRVIKKHFSDRSRRQRLLIIDRANRGKITALNLTLKEKKKKKKVIAFVVS